MAGLLRSQSYNSFVLNGRSRQMNHVTAHPVGLYPSERLADAVQLQAHEGDSLDRR